MKKPLPEIAAILRDSLTRCPDTLPYLGDTRLIGDAFRHDDWRKIFHWIRWFEQDRRALERFSRTVAAVDEALADLAELGRANGSETRIPPQFADFLKLRIATAYFPDSRAVIERATHGSAFYAAQQMLKHVPEDAWRQRSS